MPASIRRFIKPPLAPARNTLRHSVADLSPIRSALGKESERIGPLELLPHNAGRLALRGCASYHLNFSN